MRKKRKEMNLNDRIEEAARRAVIDQPNLAYYGQFLFHESERVRVHFKEHGKESFSVDIFQGGHPDFKGIDTVEVLTEQINQELMKIKQNNQ